MGGPGRPHAGHIQQQADARYDDEHADDQQEERDAGAFKVGQQRNRDTHRQHGRIHGHNGPRTFAGEKAAQPTPSTITNEAPIHSVMRMRRRCSSLRSDRLGASGSVCITEVNQP